MITTICLIILVFAILHKPTGRLLDSLKGVDWKKFSDTAWMRIKSFAAGAGRSATRLLLYFIIRSPASSSPPSKKLSCTLVLYI